MQYITTFNATFFIMFALLAVTAAVGFIGNRVARSRGKENEFNLFIHQYRWIIHVLWLTIYGVAFYHSVAGTTTFFLYAMIAALATIVITSRISSIHLAREALERHDQASEEARVRNAGLFDRAVESDRRPADPRIVEAAEKLFNFKAE